MGFVTKSLCFAFKIKYYSRRLLTNHFKTDKQRCYRYPFISCPEWFEMNWTLKKGFWFIDLERGNICKRETSPRKLETSVLSLASNASSLFLKLSFMPCITPKENSLLSLFLTHKKIRDFRNLLIFLKGETEKFLPNPFIIYSKNNLEFRNR